MALRSPQIVPLSEAAAVTVAVVIPSFKVSRFVLGVIDKIGPEVSLIYVVDDCCPEHSGKLVASRCKDPRVRIVYNVNNQGVGGATMAGYRSAIADGADIIVKIDGDGQIDPSLIKRFIAPIVRGQADYTKGNRFYQRESLLQMPPLRIFGNAALSLITKASSGYWSVVDPTNGLTCIHARVAENLPLQKISKRYFFESDMLFRLNILRAVVRDVPMSSCYGLEESGLRIGKIIPEFLAKHMRNLGKRLFYTYMLHDVTVATMDFIIGGVFVSFGAIFGGVSWYNSSVLHKLTSSGTVMLAAMPIIIGTQLILAAITHDINNVPRQAIHQDL